MSDTNKLKPCPFCGSDNVKQGGDDKTVGAWCLNCEASGPNGYLTINGEHDWNTRADLAPKVKPLEWLYSENFKCLISDQYTVQYEYDAMGIGAWAMGRNDILLSDHPSESEAIAAAQAHHDALILSALVAHGEE